MLALEMSARERDALDELVRFKDPEFARTAAAEVRAIRKVMGWPLERVSAHTKAIEKEQLE